MLTSVAQCVATYTRRFLVRPPYFSTVRDARLCLSIVIPAYKEPEILATLKSLAACRRPSGMVEIILCINAPENSPEGVLEINELAINQINEWTGSEQPDFLRTFLIREESLPGKHAGAGLARKIGMDEAVQRWANTGKDGPIICLDADCKVSENYLIKAEEAFNEPNVKVAHFDFEHLYQQEPDPLLKKGIIQYELHLRYHVQGLKWASYPFAIHTVGSCMAVRASVYARSGGMNRRKAGEDFYFLHKVAPLGGWQNIHAKVYPSCRASDRVPFGTGRAQLEWLKDPDAYLTYNPVIYGMLRPFFQKVGELYEQHEPYGVLPGFFDDFLKKMNMQNRIDEMKSESKNKEVFLKKFWQWMDGFMVLKLTHYLRDKGFSDIPVRKAAQSLLLDRHITPSGSLEGLLEQYRQLDG